MSNIECACIVFFNIKSKGLPKQNVADDNFSVSQQNYLQPYNTSVTLSSKPNFQST